MYNVYNLPSCFVEIEHKELFGEYVYILVAVIRGKEYKTLRKSISHFYADTYDACKQLVIEFYNFKIKYITNNEYIASIKIKQLMKYPS